MEDLETRELYFLVAEFLDRTPCQAAAQALKRELYEHRLLGSEHTWTGEALPATFETLRSRYALPPGQLLRHLRTVALAPGGGAVRSLLIAPPREDGTRKIAKALVETCHELRIVKAELRALDAREAFDCGLAGPARVDAGGRGKCHSHALAPLSARSGKSRWGGGRPPTTTCVYTSA